MKIVANSVPKSGTHLLLQLLGLLGFEQGNLTIGEHFLLGRLPLAKRFLRGPLLNKDSITLGVENPKKVRRRWLERRIAEIPEQRAILAHLPYTPEAAELLRANRMPMVVIFRDPRDVAVSYMHWLKQRPQLYHHSEYAALPNDHERLLIAIRRGKLGEYTLRPMEKQYRQILKWGKSEGALLVRFEDLVGEKGGGSSEVQHETIKRVCEYLALNVDKQRVISVQKELFGPTSTFRKGQIGGWRTEFTKEHKNAVKDVAGELLIDLDYEKNLEW